MAGALPDFEAFDIECEEPSSSVSQRWKLWLERFENMTVAMDIEADLKRKKALILHYMGTKCYERYSKNLKAESDDYEDVVRKMTNYANGLQNSKQKEGLNFVFDNSVQLNNSFRVKVSRLHRNPRQKNLYFSLPTSMPPSNTSDESGFHTAELNRAEVQPLISGTSDQLQSSLEGSLLHGEELYKNITKKLSLRATFENLEKEEKENKNKPSAEQSSYDQIQNKPKPVAKVKPTLYSATSYLIDDLRIMSENFLQPSNQFGVVVAKTELASTTCLWTGPKYTSTGKFSIHRGDDHEWVYVKGENNTHCYYYVVNMPREKLPSVRMIASKYKKIFNSQLGNRFPSLHGIFWNGEKLKLFFSVPKPFHDFDPFEDVLQHQPIDMPNLVEIIRQILTGLQVLHEKDIVLCQIKPGSILLYRVNDSFQVLLPDLRKAMPSGYIPHTTPLELDSFMPPEMQAPIPVYTTAYDVYNFSNYILTRVPEECRNQLGDNFHTLLKLGVSQDPYYRPKIQEFLSLM